MNTTADDISSMFDAAGLTASNIKTTREPMEKIVARIRTKLMQGFLEILKEKEE